MKGMFIVLEGGDGAGKSSQQTLLAAYFKKSGRKVRTLHFPRLQTKPYGEMIAAFLRGDYGPLDSVHPRLAALLYALDRQEAAALIKDSLAAGEVFLADRYIFSNIAYQCAKTDDPAEKKALASWIETLEYGHNGIPRPDLTLYLDVPLAFALGNLAKERAGADRDYLKGAKDIHEASVELQQKVRAEFLALAKSRAGEMGVVNCAGDNGGIADKAVIHSRIIDALRYYDLL